MKRVFADTFYYIALLSPRDQAHSKAMDISRRYRGQFITSEFVLIELADAFSAPLERPTCLDLIDSLTDSQDVTIVRATSKLYREALDLYRHRPDKDWPLTDCTSFVIMQQQEIQDVLTADTHFRQAGFNPLLLDQ